MSHALTCCVLRASEPPVLTTQRKIRLAMERQRTDALLKDLTRVHAESDMSSVLSWDDLSETMKKVYDNNQFDYEKEVVQNSSILGRELIESELAKNGMRIVQNDGKTGDLWNNCFLITVIQHATGHYGAGYVQVINQYREILKDAGLVDLNVMFTASSEAAKTLVDLINGDPGVHPKLYVHVISNINGTTYVDKLGDPSPESRKVVTLDHCGHFEAIEAVPSETAASQWPHIRVSSDDA
jgi:hypothetical protein